MILLHAKGGVHMNKEKIGGEELRPVATVVRGDTLLILRYAGKKSDVLVKLLAVAGEEYHTGTYSGILPEDKVYVQIGDGTEQDLSDFWNEYSAAYSPENS